MQLRTNRHLDNQIVSTLLNHVWDLTPPGLDDPDELNEYEARAYLDHYKDLLYDRQLIQAEEMSLAEIGNQCETVVEIVRIVQENRHRPLSQIKDAIASGHPTWLVRQNDQKALSKILDFAVRLWLFVPLDADVVARKRGLKLIDAMEEFDRTTIKIEAERSIPPKRNLTGSLSFDLTVENLIIKAGLIFRPTSILAKHLEMEHFATSTEVRVFRHVKALEKWKNADHSDIFPDKFLDEVCQTLHLLFPIKERTMIRRSKSLAKRYALDVETDLEANFELGRLEQLDLASYPYFGDRLKKLQDHYDNAIPRTLRQLWYDRRRPVEWAILWVALVVFLLTLIFGLISSITGILQIVLR